MARRNGFVGLGSQSSFNPNRRKVTGAPTKKNPGYKIGGFVNKAAARPQPRPALGPAPAPAIPAKPAVVGQHMVPDSTYNDVIGHINTGETQSLNQLGGQETKINQDYGITDPTDPLNRAAALKKAFLNNYRGAGASLAAQGHLYSGAHERALARTRAQYDQDYHDLYQAWQGAIQGIGTQREAVKYQSEGDRLQAFQDWLARAPAAEDITPVSAGATAPAATPKGSTAPARTFPSSAVKPLPISPSTGYAPTTGARQTVRQNLHPAGADVGLADPFGHRKSGSKAKAPNVPKATVKGLAQPHGIGSGMKKPAAKPRRKRR